MRFPATLQLLNFIGTLPCRQEGAVWNIVDAGIRPVSSRTVMQHQQFEQDLTHLELIIPLLARGNPLALRYWRRRIVSLSAWQHLVPGGRERVTRLLALFNDIEQGTALCRPAA